MVSLALSVFFLMNSSAVSRDRYGVSAVFFHGGKGGGYSPRSRRFFDPALYRIVMFDQRGSGKSVPNASDDMEASLVENNTPKLVADIELLASIVGALFSEGRGALLWHLHTHKRMPTAARRCSCAVCFSLAPMKLSTSWTTAGLSARLLTQ